MSYWGKVLNKKLFLYLNNVLYSETFSQGKKFANLFDKLSQMMKLINFWEINFCEINFREWRNCWNNLGQFLEKKGTDAILLDKLSQIGNESRFLWDKLSRMSDFEFFVGETFCGKGSNSRKFIWRMFPNKVSSCFRHGNYKKNVMSFF